MTSFESTDDEPQFLRTIGPKSFTVWTKCSYIIQANGDGAPAFQLFKSVADNDDLFYQLHYIEFMNSEMDFLAGGMDAEYTGRNLTADTFVNPMAGAAMLFGDGNRLGWYPNQF